MNALVTLGLGAWAGVPIGAGLGYLIGFPKGRTQGIRDEKAADQRWKDHLRNRTTELKIIEHQTDDKHICYPGCPGTE